MLLKKLSQSLRVAMALVVATFSTGLLPTSAAYAATTNPCTTGSVIAKYEWNKTTNVYDAEFGSNAVVIDAGSTAESGSYSVMPGYDVNELLIKGGQTTVSAADTGTFNNQALVKEVKDGKTVYQDISNIQFCGTTTTPTPNQPTVTATPQVCEEGDVTQDVLVTVTNTDDATNEAETYEITVAGTYVLTTASIADGTSGSVTFTGLPAGTHSVAVLGSDGTTANTTVTVAECTQQPPVQTPVNPALPTVTDVCGTAGDSIVKPQDSAQITYSLNGNVVTATLVNPSTHDFGADLNGYVVAQDGTTATYTATFPNNLPCLTAIPCPNPANGGVITQNSGWTLAGGEFVDGGVEFTSNNWSASYIGVEMDYMISEALELGWTIDGSVAGASGTAIIFVTASGANIHYEPEPYTDDFWTNTPGILPVSGGGQGGPYSGSLQDLLDMGDQTITETYFYFTSQTANTITLESLSFNCTTYTFDKEGEVLGEDKVMICHATSSVMNPYNKISVSVNAANGGNDNGDHYNEHDGPIFNPDTNKNGDDWGDIIPPIAGAHNGLNWNAQGQAIYNNPDGDCGYVTPVDSCPLVPGVQSDTTLCPPGQGGGQTLGSNTTKTPAAPQILGTTTELPAALPSTGGEQNPMLILLASLMAYGIAYLFQGRRQLNQTRA